MREREKNVVKKFFTDNHIKIAYHIFLAGGSSYPHHDYISTGYLPGFIFWQHWNNKEATSELLVDGHLIIDKASNLIWTGVCTVLEHHVGTGSAIATVWVRNTHNDGLLNRRVVQGYLLQFCGRNLKREK